MALVTKSGRELRVGDWLCTGDDWRDPGKLFEVVGIDGDVAHVRELIFVFDSRVDMSLALGDHHFWSAEDVRKMCG